MFKKIILFVLLMFTGFQCTTNKDPLSSNIAEPDTVIDRKPNIYIYPPSACDMTLALSFPKGGRVTVSEPPYLNGWSFHVEPSGLIDNQYRYLYYESAIPAITQPDGWIVKRSSLTEFIVQNMQACGFNSTEIKDFTDYWIPLLNDHPYYKICPVYTDQIEQYVKFELSIIPDSVLRVIYLIQGLKDNELVQIQEPSIPLFTRNGFTIVEWGVILLE